MAREIGSTSVKSGSLVPRIQETDSKQLSPQQAERSIQQSSRPDVIPVIPNGVPVITPQSGPVCGKVWVQKSGKVEIGNKTIIHGPVTYICPNKDTKDQNDFDIEQIDGKIWDLSTYSKKCKILTLFFFILIVSLIITTAIVFSRKSENQIPPTEFRIVNRSEWGALKPKYIKKLVTPVPYVIISHSARNECYTLAHCCQTVKSIQEFQLNSPIFEQNFKTKYSDIGNNFFIGGDGLAYEGRGWDVLSPDPGDNYNLKSLSIQFLGNFMLKIPPKRQIDAFFKLLRIGVENNKLGTNYTIYFHKQFYATESPGTMFIKLIRTWDRWKPIES